MRIGALGAARITPPALLEAAATLPEVEVVAVAARDRGRAAELAAAHGIETVHGSYAELVADDGLDAVYIALPPSEHARWSIAALEAGRHVLVEKPFACNADEARAMVAAAGRARRVLVEAFHWRYHPLAARMLELVPELGTLRHGEAVFRTAIPEGDIRHARELGGGATMDLGCYPVHWLRTLVGAEPVVTGATATVGAPGIDVSCTADLRFPSGATGRVTSAMDGPAGPPEWWLRLEGDRGTLRAVNPCVSHLGNRLVVELADGRRVDEEVTGRTTYSYQLEAFVAAVAGAPAPTGGADAVANMVVIDAIYEAAGLGRRGRPATA